jgi:hypothetical protein
MVVSQRKKQKARLSMRYMGLYFLLLIISTFISMLFQGSIINYIIAFGYIRLILLFYFLQIHCEKEILRKAVYSVVVVNFVVMLLQYFSDTAALWSYELFAKSSSQALGYFYQIGTMGRLTGTFSNILPAACLMLFAFIIALSHYCENHSESKKNIFVILLALICGGLTVSRTFIMGLPLIVFSWVFFSKVFHNKEFDIFRGKRILPVLIIAIFVVAVVLFKDLLRMSNVINYYLENILYGQLFASRYAESGVLIDAIDVIKDNLLIGIGSTKLHSEFIGDSQYITILHNTGIIGLVVIISMFINYTKRLISARSVSGLTVIVLIVALGFAGTTVFSTVGIVLLTYVSMCVQERSVINTCSQRTCVNVKAVSCYSRVSLKQD